MIKGFYFSLGFYWPSQKRSILEASDLLIIFFKDLSEIDRRFMVPVFLSNTGHKVEIDLTASNQVIKVSELILSSLRQDIQEHDNIYNPTIEFSRDFGFTIAFGFRNEDIVLTGRIGSAENEGLSFSFTNVDFEETIEWYLKVLKHCVNTTSSYFGSMQLKVLEFTKKISDIKYPIGLITFYSNQLPFRITSYLEDVFYEKNSSGIFVITSRDEITANKDEYEKFKDLLLKLNSDLRENIPNILRDS